MNSLRDYCRQLKLSNLIEYINNYASKEQEEFLIKLFEYEITNRRVKRINRNMNQAKFDVIKTFEDYSFEGITIPPTITPEDIIGGSYIKKRENLILYGMQGSGKSHMAIATGVNACNNEYRVKFYKVATLVNELIDARNNDTIIRYLKTFQKLDLLILDEWGYIPVDVEGAKLLFQVVSDCYEKRSVIITTNLEFGKWNGIFYDEKLTGAILDRMIHHSHLLIFNRESYRKKHSLMNQK